MAMDLGLNKNDVKIGKREDMLPLIENDKCGLLEGKNG